MQEKKSTHIQTIKGLSLQDQYINNAILPSSVFSVVAIGYPAGDTSFPLTLLQRLHPDLSVAWIIMEYGIADAVDSHQAAAWLETLRQHTVLPVVTASPDTIVEAGHLYWVSPGFSLQLVKKQLVFRVAVNGAKSDGSADQFLATLAAGAPQSHAVLLSPAIADRMTSGLQVVRAEGGFSFVVTDDPPFLHRRLSGFSADFVLPAIKAAAVLHALLPRFSPGGSMPAEPKAVQADLDQISQLLLKEKGLDLSPYPIREIWRRLHHRMCIHDVLTLEGYSTVLKEDIEELNLLCDELYTTLAGFFLEPAMESVLEKEILPALLSRHRSDTPLRIWLPRCIGGPSAYAIAMHVLDHLQTHKEMVPVQIFATDLNRAAIDRARMGIYSEEELTGLSQRRIRKYFTKKPEGYWVSPALRDICVFATQNLLKDPPFSHVDLIISGSTLVGLNNSSIDRAFRSFHYALNSHGFLMPGRMRSKDYPEELFQLQSEQPFVFARKEVPVSFEPLYPLQSLREGEKEADKLLLAGYVPAAMLIDEQYKVIRFYGDLEPYLRRSTDRPSLHVLRMVKDDLVFELNELIEQSDKQMRPLKKEGIPLTQEDDTPLLSIEVAPLYSSGRKWRLVVIREMPVPMPAPERPLGRGLSAKDLRILALENQLNEMRGLLLTANQDSAQIQQALEQANEEIMASNEELQSVNEQLQSVNEQLLSFNVELNTVNENLSSRNRELELSVDYAHAIVASLHQPLVVLQEDGRIRTANPSFCQFLKVDAREMSGVPLFAIGNGVLDRPPLQISMRQLLDKKISSADLEMKTEIPGQGDRILAISVVRMQKIKDALPGIILALEDVTQRRLDERFKDDFIGIASHELKTPATTIQAYSQLLYEELANAPDPGSAQLVRKLNGQVSRLTRLTKDLLDVTGISQGLVQLRKEFFDIGQLIRATVEELQVTTPIRLVLEPENALPRIRGDQERIGQVLTNLLSNAIKYAEGTREIIIRAGSAAKHIWISVQDFGIGMSPESLKKIFDRFYRLDEASSGRLPGVGLGLYISSEIVRRHGGEITVSSEKEKGSVFTVHLPIR